ncbi:porin [Pseudochelatococcus sp. B33]
MVTSVKGMLIGGVAGLVVVPAALAADLPIAKSAPVEYVRVCSTHGEGFFYVPGTDTCIRIGGRVRAEFGYQQPKGGTVVETDSLGNVTAAWKDGRRQDVTGIRARGRLDVDVRTPTDYGTLRAFLRYEIDKNSGIFDATDSGALLEKAYIQWAGITAGQVQSFFDFYANDLNWGNGFETSFGSDLSTNVFAYTATFGEGFSATLSIEDANARRVNPDVYDAAGQRLPDIVANLNVDQDWGAAQLSGALHQLSSASIHAPWGGQWGQRVDTTYGWAVQGGVKLNLTTLAAGDVLWLQAAYADGALSYLGVGDVAYADYTSLVTDGAIINGDIKKTRGWNATAAFLHYWTPSVRQSLFGSYTGVSYDNAVKVDYVDLRNFDAWSVGSNVIWSPVSDFDIGVEVLYSKVERKTFQNEILARGLKSEDAVTGRVRLQRDF